MTHNFWIVAAAKQSTRQILNKIKSVLLTKLQLCFYIHRDNLSEINNVQLSMIHQPQANHSLCFLQNQLSYSEESWHHQSLNPNCLFFYSPKSILMHLPNHLHSTIMLSDSNDREVGMICRVIHWT